MKDLIKQCAHFPGEVIRPGRNFPNFFNCFYHAIITTDSFYFWDFPYLKQIKPTEKSFLLALFLLQTITNSTIK